MGRAAAPLTVPLMLAVAKQRTPTKEETYFGGDDGFVEDSKKTKKCTGIVSVGGNHTRVPLAPGKKQKSRQSLKVITKTTSII